MLRIYSTCFVFAIVCAASAQSLFSSATVISGGGGGDTTQTDDTEAFRAESFGAATGTARGQSGFGLLRAYAAVDGAEGPAPDDVFAQGFASFTDSITLTGGTGTGTYLIDYAVDGTFSGGAGVVKSANVNWDNLPNGVPGGLGGGPQTILGQFPLAFTYGVAFQIRAELYAQATLPAGSRESGIVDYSSSARIAAIRIQNDDGGSIAGVSATSASGHAYPTPTPVPEPASLAALGLGLLTLRRRYARA